MKTPDEIKKGLEVCRADECHGHHTGCPYDDDFFCIMHICGDAIAYIEHLENSANLNPLRDAIYEDAVAHGLFEDFDRIKNPVRKRRALAMRIMEEAAELYAAADDIEHYAEEAADVTLITGDVCGYLGIDWETAVRRKMEINRNRPWKHGKEDACNT